MHTIQTIYDSIAKDHPQLSAEHLDDILATLEELEKLFGAEYFNQATTLQNVIRLVGLKFEVTNGILFDMIEEELHGDVELLDWAMRNKVKVSNKIEALKKLQGSFPDYPNTHLNPFVEKLLTLTITTMTKKGNSVIMKGNSVGDLIIADPENMYYLMPKQNLKKENP